MSDLELVERLVADAFQSADPRAALRAAADAPGLSDDARARLRAAAPDGVRVAGLLIARLRFERLTNGSRAARAWFERDPAGFARAFKRYHAEVAPTVDGPAQEAAAFAAWTANEPG